MTDHSKYNNGFTADDIERYHSGKMSPLEMHQLEKAAMEDPFLADALEGYAFTPTASEDRVWLQSQLQAKTEGAKVVPVKRFNTNQFLRIAALFVLLIGCGWAVYQFGFNKKDNDLAVAKAPEVKNDSPLKEETTSNEATLNQSLTNKDTNANTRPEADDTNLNTQKTTIENKGDGVVALSTQNRHTGRINGTEEQDKTKRMMKLPQNQTEGLESASVANKIDGLFTKADSSNKKEIDSSNRDFVASAPQTVTPGKDNVIVLQRNKNSEPVAEVILGKSMKDSAHRRPSITFEEAVPEKGSQYFDDYIAQNLELPEEELQKNLSGEVKLSFDVNEAGEAVNIKVVKSLCNECDKQAIRLLQQGPKWVKKKNTKKGTVSIKF
jgi:hypothetical protein